jgi:hypothetical protein
MVQADFGISLSKGRSNVRLRAPWSYDKSALIERTSPDERGPTLRLKIAAGLGCEAAKAILNGTSERGQALPDLLP